MRRKLIILSIILLFFCYCSERQRTNQFDVTNKGFSTPTPCYTWGSPVYDPYNGYLIGVVIGIEFTDALPRTFSFDHKFFFNGQNVLDFGQTVNSGAENYGIQIYYGGDPFPVGDYCLKIYWGEFGYGAFVFSVVPSGNATEFKGLTLENGIERIKDWYSVNLAQ